MCEKGHNMLLKEVFQKFPAIKPVIERLWCVPATSAPVERVFSQSGLILRPNRSRMSDKLLEQNIFEKQYRTMKILMYYIAIKLLAFLFEILLFC